MLARIAIAARSVETVFLKEFLRLSYRVFI